MINIQTRVFVILLSIAVLLYVINLVRTRKLREEFALLWLATGVLVVTAALLVDWLDALSYVLGIEYPPAFLFLLAFLGLLLICSQFSVNISKLADQNKVLVQEMGMLSYRVEQLEKALEKAHQKQKTARDGNSRHPLVANTARGKCLNSKEQIRSQGSMVHHKNSV